MNLWAWLLITWVRAFEWRKNWLIWTPTSRVMGGVEMVKFLWKKNFDIFSKKCKNGQKWGFWYFLKFFDKKLKIFILFKFVPKPPKKANKTYQTSGSCLTVIFSNFFWLRKFLYFWKLKKIHNIWRWSEDKTPRPSAREASRHLGFQAERLPHEKTG